MKVCPGIRPIMIANIQCHLLCTLFDARMCFLCCLSSRRLRQVLVVILVSLFMIEFE